MSSIIATLDSGQAVRALFTAIGISGLLLIGRRSRWGWVMGALAQAAWGTYWIVQGDPTQAFVTAVYGNTYLWNWWHWRRRDRARAHETARLLAAVAVQHGPDGELRAGYPQRGRGITDPRCQP